MRRVSTTFLILLLAATLALGIAWRQVEGLPVGSGNSVLLVVSGGVLLLTLLGLGRILYVTTRTQTARSESKQEAGHG
ncbi:MAG: hypothetical protein K8L99_02885 [Anaerolineae bacterium]|nr:hypothetical protein [Anaerolineae bacterium]